jgi:transposase
MTMFELVEAMTSYHKRSYGFGTIVATALPEVELIKSIPGVGDKLAATIVSEIGDAHQFEDAKQLWHLRDWIQGHIVRGKLWLPATG